MTGIGIGLGLWNWSGGTGMPQFVRNSLIAYDSGLGVTLNGSTVSAWANQGRGGSAYDAAQATAANQPTYTASDPDANGRPSLLFSGVPGDDYLVAATGALMKFLHDGSGCTVYAVVESDNAVTRYIFSTRDSGTGGPGARHEKPTSANFATRISDGSVNIVNKGSSAARDADVFAACAWRFEDGVATEFDIQVDGGTPDTSASGAPSAADAQGALHIGTTVGLVGALGGRLCALIIDDRRHTDQEVAEMNAWLHGRFINSLPQFLRRNLMVFESSLGVTLNGSTVSDWANQGYGGSSYDLAQATAAEQPTYTQSDAAFANKPVLTFDGSDDYMAGATQTLVRFLHEGNGATVYTVASPASGASLAQALVATKDSGGGEPGYRLQVGTSGTANCTIRNVGSIIISLSTSSDASGAANLVTQRYEEGFAPESELYVGGAQEATANSTGAPSANDPQSMLYIGRTTNDSNHLDGGLASVIIDNTRHDDTLRAQHEAWLLGRYGI